MTAPKLPDGDQAPDVRELSEAEGWEFLDQSARYHLGISGEEFVRRWQAGEYPDPDGTPAMHVVMALPFAGVRP
jgi:hypothetical protein